MSRSSSPSSKDDDIDFETFSPLAAIPEDSLVRLASNIAERVLQAPSNPLDCRLVRRICGSYNIVHVLEVHGVKLIIRVPVTGWGPGRTATVAQALESQVSTMRLIRRTTSIPVPEIHGLDTTSNNAIGAPYVCMSFLPGQTVSEIWFDDSDTELRENRRLSILANLAKTMADFSRLEFDKLGSVMEDETGAIHVGPTYDWYENDDDTLRVEVLGGPYNSASEYLQSQLVLGDKNVWALAAAKVLETLLRISPGLDSQDGFVLCPPDFDSQNVLVDREGNITGIIDWDLAHTMPRRLGYARYPGWITRDWDPLMYGWPKITDSEDSPGTLNRYRLYYASEVGKALNWEGDWKFTDKSHIVEAVWNAALNGTNRLEICRKFVQVAIGDGTNALDVLHQIGEDKYNEDGWEVLESNLRKLFD